MMGPVLKAMPVEEWDKRDEMLVKSKKKRSLKNERKTTCKPERRRILVLDLQAYTMNHSLFEVKLIFFRLFCIYTDCVYHYTHAEPHNVVHCHYSIDAKLKEKDNMYV